MSEKFSSGTINSKQTTNKQIRQTKYVTKLIKEGSTKIVNFVTPKAGNPVLECGHISHTMKMYYVFEFFLLEVFVL